MDLTPREKDKLLIFTAGLLAEHAAEDVLEPARLAAAGTRGGEARAGSHGPHLVVLAALLLVGEHGVRLADLLEARLGRRIRVAVRVVLPRELAVGLLEVGLRDVLGHSEDLVEVLVEPVLTGHIPPLALLSGHGDDDLRGPQLARAESVADLDDLEDRRHLGAGGGCLEDRLVLLRIERLARGAVRDHTELLGDRAHLVADHGEGGALDEVAVLGRAVEVVERHGRLPVVQRPDPDVAGLTGQYQRLKSQEKRWTTGG